MGRFRESVAAPPGRYLQNPLCFCMQIPLVRIHLFKGSYLRERVMGPQNSRIHIRLRQNIRSAVRTRRLCAGVCVRIRFRRSLGFAGQEAQVARPGELWGRSQGSRASVCSRGTLFNISFHHMAGNVYCWNSPYAAR